MPKTLSSPLVFDSPHSGYIIPNDFKPACPEDYLHRTRDCFVDQLFSFVPQQGSPLLFAEFFRSYIDLNRQHTDIDPQLLSTEWPEYKKTSAKSRMGIGLIHRVCMNHKPIALYNRKLTVSEIKQRINKYYHPYYQELENLLQQAYKTYGFFWHINCHSMMSSPVFTRENSKRPDFCLGDLDGNSCDPDMTHFVSEALEDLGYKVSINKPYKGAELIKHFSNPKTDRHSLQIEINKSLYMDEQKITKNKNFNNLRQDLDTLVKGMNIHIKDYLQSQVAD